MNAWPILVVITLLTICPQVACRHIDRIDESFLREDRDFTIQLFSPLTRDDSLRIQTEWNRFLIALREWEANPAISPFSPANRVTIEATVGDVLMGYFHEYRSDVVHKILVKEIRKTGIVSIDVFDLTKRLRVTGEWYYFFFRGDSIVFRGSWI